MVYCWMWMCMFFFLVLFVSISFFLVSISSFSALTSAQLPSLYINTDWLPPKSQPINITIINTQPWTGWVGRFCGVFLCNISVVFFFLVVAYKNKATNFLTSDVPYRTLLYRILTIRPRPVAKWFWWWYYTDLKSIIEKVQSSHN